MKNPDRHSDHRRRREAGEGGETPDGRHIADALYGGEPSTLEPNAEEEKDEDPEPTLFPDENRDMANPNLDRSKRHEREVVNQAEDAGLFAERAYASNGKSLGESEETDVLLQAPGRNVRVQCKRRKSVANYLTCENADVVVTREDRGENLVVLPLDDFLELLSQR